MKVFFLCGGVGKRMVPINKDKFLLTFLGKTLLEHQIERAVEAGVDEFVVVTSAHSSDEVRKVFSIFPKVKVQFALQKEARGMADALLEARQFLQGDVLVVNPNDLVETSAYSNLIQARKSSDGFTYLLARRVQEYFPGGYLIVGNDGILEHIIEKPEPGTEPSDLINLVLHLHTDIQEFLKRIELASMNSDDAYERALDIVVKEGRQIKVVEYDGLWQAIKYPWHILGAMEQLLSQAEGYVSPQAKISDRAVIEGKVIIESGVKVFENAVIKGPCYIGRDSIVGNGALVRDFAHIGERCTVGFGTEIKHSYIGDDCWFHMNYMGDSIIGSRCSFGAGTVTANLRFDEGEIRVKVAEKVCSTGLEKLGAFIGDDSRTGVNVSLMPGVKVGPRSIVGSHACLSRDLGEDMAAFAQGELKIIERETALDFDKRNDYKKKLEG